MSTPRLTHRGELPFGGFSKPLIALGLVMVLVAAGFAGGLIAGAVRSTSRTTTVIESGPATASIPASPNGPWRAVYAQAAAGTVEITALVTTTVITPFGQRQEQGTALGSGFVLGRSLLRTPAPVVPRWLRRAFPGGLFDMTEGRRRFADDLPDRWPERPLWLCAVDITGGRRVVLGAPGSPPTGLRRAVMASCAIPGLYQPIRIDGQTLVDGGAHSSTNLDLVADGGFDLVVAVAPMAFDTDRAPGPLAQLARRVPARQLAGEAALARRRGLTVLMIRPSRAEVRIHGVNLMRSTGWERLAVSAYDATARVLETPRFRDALGGLAA